MSITHSFTCSHLILMRNPSDMNQVQNLARKLFASKAKAFLKLYTQALLDAQQINNNPYGITYFAICDTSPIYNVSGYLVVNLEICRVDDQRLYTGVAFDYEMCIVYQFAASK